MPKDYVAFSIWKKMTFWSSLASILGFCLTIITAGYSFPQSSHGSDHKKSRDPLGVSSPSQGLNILIPIFRNLTQTKEQISLPVEACGQEQTSQPPLTVDRYSADARDLLEEALTNHAEIPVVSRERLAQAVCEMELGRSGLIDNKTAAQLGKLLGANIQVEGTIDNIRVNKHKFKGYGIESFRTTVTARLNIRFVSIETGTLLLSKTLEGEEENVSTSFGSMDDSDMVAAAIRNAINNYEDIGELKAKLSNKM